MASSRTVAKFRAFYTKRGICTTDTNMIREQWLRMNMPEHNSYDQEQSRDADDALEQRPHMHKPEHNNSDQEQSLPEGTHFEAILHRPVIIPRTAAGDKEIGQECAEALMRDRHHTTISRAHDPMRWGNPSGLSTLNKLDEALRGLKVQQAELKDRYSELKDKCSELEICNEWYLNGRNRFLSTYIRDKVPDRMTPIDWEIIKLGTVAVHHGDPSVDALLYKKETRTDRITFKELYGMEPEQVLAYKGDKITLRVLSLHATLKADKKCIVSKTFLESFGTFRDALAAGGWRRDYLEEASAPETQAYWAFRKEYDSVIAFNERHHGELRRSGHRKTKARSVPSGKGI